MPLHCTHKLKTINMPIYKFVTLRNHKFINPMCGMAHEWHASYRYVLCSYSGMLELKYAEMISKIVIADDIGENHVLILVFMNRYIQQIDKNQIS